MTATLKKPLRRIVQLRGMAFVVELTPDGKVSVRRPGAQRRAVWDLEILVTQSAKSLLSKVERARTMHITPPPIEIHRGEDTRRHTRLAGERLEGEPAIADGNVRWWCPHRACVVQMPAAGGTCPACNDVITVHEAGVELQRRRFWTAP